MDKSISLSCSKIHEENDKRKLIITSEKKSFEKLTDFVIKNTQREQQDDGFYMMDMERPITLFKQWCENLPRVRPFYAIKCNPDPILVRQLHMLGTGFDCASIKEMECAFKVGSRKEDIIYAHPCKKLSHLSFAARSGISMMTFDSNEELCKIKRQHPNARLLLRFAPLIKASLFDCNNFKYGAAVEDSVDLLESAKAMELNVIGVSFHVGTCCYDKSCYVDAIESARYIFDEGKKLGFSFNVLDIGGGFPGFRRDFEEALFFKLCKAINQSLDEHFPECMGINIMAEPGTYFADSSFKLVTNIIAIKEVTRKMVERVHNPPLKLNNHEEKGYMYYIDDGRYGSFSDIPDTDFRVAPIEKTSKLTYPSCICGHFLAGLDIVKEDCQLPKLSIGDWLYFDCFGAYTSTMLCNFNGFGNVKCTYYYATSKVWTSIQLNASQDFNASITFLE